MRQITPQNYTKDKYYPSVVRAVTQCLAKSAAVTTVDVFVTMNLLRQDAVLDWRFGRVPYLEKVIQCNLEKAERILRLLRYHAEKSDLRPSFTAFKKWGRGPLRFSKSGIERLEMAYSTHFIRPSAKKPADSPVAGSVVQLDANSAIAVATLFG